jgi:hypothetical protein
VVLKLTPCVIGLFESINFKALDAYLGVDHIIHYDGMLVSFFFHYTSNLARKRRMVIWPAQFLARSPPVPINHAILT